MNPDKLPRYDRRRTYKWNYDHPPDPVNVEEARVAGDWSFCGLPVRSPLGIPAGPLLNGRWCLYYASLGFDVLTYKTVRSVARECYPPPNLQPVDCGQLAGGESNLPAVSEMSGSWAVSYGMPSMAPALWRKDIAMTRDKLPPGKLLSVSVVGTIQDGWTTEDLGRDYARCAKWAVESGADVIETNFSCPNVATCDGQLYQHATDSALVAAIVRQAIGETPYIVKIGHVETEEQAADWLQHVARHIDAIAMTNSIATTITAKDGSPLFDGQKRGICGDATRTASLAQTKMFAKLIGDRQHELSIIGVGGTSQASHVDQYLAAGAHAVHIATAAMVDPGVALKIRSELRREAASR